MPGAIETIGRAVRDRLLAPAPPERLAGTRVLMGAYTVGYLARRVRMFAKVHRTDPALFAPVGPVRVLQRPLPPVVADGLVIAELAASAAFTLGIAHRITGPVHAGLLLWTLSYRNSWSMVFHNDNSLVWHTLIAGVSPAADAWSIDSLLRGRAGRPAPAADWRYAYPARLMSGVTAIVYWLSGVAKLEGPMGWRWATGESLRGQVAADGLRKEVLGSSATSLGVRLYNRRWVWALGAAPSLAIELLAPLALVHPVVGRLWALGAFSMHWGIKAIMGITFRYQLSGGAYASFVPWERLPAVAVAAARRALGG
ncbi:hypothetical protein [Agrococcus baldri]|uniref:HTTM domain-containing protein n=1 Tax=Agrococcus baldri TaxID=153730 RepID=A0AA87URP0_9MICO|nr:hypothetical protein [Agrococcus baldri]GEK79993.1 hypothetical protein ABA31_13440 [Agrococcus baldri]